MTIQRIDDGSSSAMVREFWIGDTEEELEIAIESIKRAYHPCGYGTYCTDIKACGFGNTPIPDNYKGKFFTRMTRFTSCD